MRMMKLPVLAMTALLTALPVPAGAGAPAKAHSAAADEARRHLLIDMIETMRLGELVILPLRRSAPAAYGNTHYMDSLAEFQLRDAMARVLAPDVSADEAKALLKALRVPAIASVHNQRIEAALHGRTGVNPDAGEERAFAAFLGTPTGKRYQWVMAQMGDGQRFAGVAGKYERSVYEEATEAMAVRLRDDAAARGQSEPVLLTPPSSDIVQIDETMAAFAKPVFQYRHAAWEMENALSRFRFDRWLEADALVTAEQRAQGQAVLALAEQAQARYRADVSAIAPVTLHAVRDPSDYPAMIAQSLRYRKLVSARVIEQQGRVHGLARALLEAGADAEASARLRQQLRQALLEAGTGRALMLGSTMDEALFEAAK